MYYYKILVLAQVSKKRREWVIAIKERVVRDTISKYIGKKVLKQGIVVLAKAYSIYIYYR